VEFIRRQANEVAHVLVGEGTLLASPTIYFHTPECIETLIINECIETHISFTKKTFVNKKENKKKNHDV